MMSILSPYESESEKCQALQNTLVAYATGAGGDDAEYQALRQEFLANQNTKSLLPDFVRTCRTLDQFWPFIKKKFPTYAERREYIWREFSPLLDFLEGKAASPSHISISQSLKAFDEVEVHGIWEKSLNRMAEYPEGAITASRTLLESVCKHILDARGVNYSDKDDLPLLYKLASTSLNLSPSQHTEEVFKQILGGCTSVVGGLGALRNKLGDAHGKGKKASKPSKRHAELSVNLAGTMAVFLIATHLEKPA